MRNAIPLSIAVGPAVWRKVAPAAVAALIAASALSPPAAAESALGRLVGLGLMLRTCAGIDDPDVRLACYDEIGKALPPADDATASPGGAESDEPKSSSSPAGPEWRVRKSRSKIDDSQTVIMALEAKEPVYNDWGSRIRPTLGIVCEENTTRAYVFADTTLEIDYDDKKSPVTYRIDRDPAIAVRLAASTNRQAIGWWTGRESIPFLRKLFDRSTLTVRLQPHRSPPIDPVFDISGIETEIEPLRQACNWPESGRAPSKQIQDRLPAPSATAE